MYDRQRSRIHEDFRQNALTVEFLPIKHEFIKVCFYKVIVPSRKPRIFRNLKRLLQLIIESKLFIFIAVELRF